MEVFQVNTNRIPRIWFKTMTIKVTMAWIKSTSHSPPKSVGRKVDIFSTSWAPEHLTAVYDSCNFSSRKWCQEKLGCWIPAQCADLQLPACWWIVACSHWLLIHLKSCGIAACPIQKQGGFSLQHLQSSIFWGDTCVLLATNICLLFLSAEWHRYFLNVGPRFQ